VTMSEPSVKLLVVAETPSVLDRLSEILAPCAEVDTAAGREDASRLAGEKLHDAILWEVAASDADAGQRARWVMEWTPPGQAGPDELLERLQRVFSEHGGAEPLDEDVLKREAEARQNELMELFESTVREGEAQRDELTRQAASLEISLQHALGQVEALRRDLDASEAEADRLRKEQEVHVRETTSLRQSLDEALAAQEQAKSTLDRMSAAHLAEREAVRLEAQKQQQEIVDGRRELGDMRRRVQESDSSLKALNDTIDSLREEMAVRGRAFEETLSKAEAARDAALSQRAEAQARLDILQAQWEQMVRG